MQATRPRIHDPRQSARQARQEARILRAHAKLMSDAGQHALAELLMTRAKKAVRS